MDAADRERIEAQLADLERRQAKLATTIQLLVGKLDALSRVVEAGADRPTPVPRGDAPAVQPPGAEELAAWVNWLVVTYELVDIPPCWPRHAALVAEFDALWLAWFETVGQGQGGLAATQWHDTLNRTVARIHDPRWGRWRRCLDNGHKDPPPQSPFDGDPAPQIATVYNPPSRRRG